MRKNIKKIAYLSWFVFALSVSLQPFAATMPPADDQAASAMDDGTMPPPDDQTPATMDDGTMPPENDQTASAMDDGTIPPENDQTPPAMDAGTMPPANDPANDQAPSDTKNQNELQVKNIRVGVADGATKITLDLTAPTKFTIEQSMAGDKLTIKSQEPVEWKGVTHSSQLAGQVQGFKTIGTGANAYLEVNTKSGTAVHGSVIEDANGSNPKYVIDLVPNNLGVPTIGQLFSNNSNFGQGGKTALAAGVIIPPVTGIEFATKDGDTVVTIQLSKAIEIPVIDNIYTHQVIISLPKVDWTKVTVPSSVMGLITDYRVDQSLPDRTNVILNIDQAGGVIGKRLTAGGKEKSSHFTIVLSTDNTKIPAWLSEVTAENLSYTTANKEDHILETRSLYYNGGALPYTNIGTGFYLTALAGQVAGVNDTKSTNNGNTTNFSRGLNGISGYVGMGYGVQIERSYFGLETLIGYQRLLGIRSEYSGGPSFATLNNQLGHNWIVAGRFGYYISPTSLLYGKAGVATSRFTIDGNGGDGTILFDNNKSITRTGFLFGAGLEAAIDDQLSARIETYQTTYQPFRAVSTSGMNAKFQPKIQEMLIGVSWKPSPMGGPDATDLYEDSVTQGIYVGGEFGMGSTSNRRTVTYPDKYKTSTLTMEPLWGMYGGYAHHLGRYYVAGEAQLGFNQTKLSESRTAVGAGTESFENALQWNLAVTGRFGYIFNHGVIGYGRVGAVASRFSHKSNNTTGTNIITLPQDKKKTLAGLRVGGGLEIFLKPSVSLRGDYNMDLYPGVTINAPNGTSENILSVRNEFKFGLAYTFPVT